MTKAQKVVADYILNNYQEVSYITIDHMALKIGVSTSSIMRCAHSLGFSGFSDMQNSLRNTLKIHMDPPYSQLVKGELSEDKLFNKVLENDIQNIQKTAKNISQEMLQNGVDLILNARKVYVVGFRGAFPLAFYLTNGLQRITGKTELLYFGLGDLVENIVTIGKEDLLVAITFPRYSKDVIRICDYASSKNCKVVSITDSYQSPLVPYSDILLPCEYSGTVFKNSLVAPMTVINYLLGAVSIKQKDSSIDLLKSSDKLLAKWDLVYDANPPNGK